jgi:hypothetical protein
VLERAPRRKLERVGVWVLADEGVPIGGRRRGDSQHIKSKKYSFKRVEKKRIENLNRFL